MIAGMTQAVLLAQSRSITDRSVDWPSWDQWQRVLLLQDHWNWTV